MFMSTKIFSAGFLVFLFCLQAQAGDYERPLVVVIPSHNNADWYARNLDSVFTQEYDNYRVIYCDDASTDNTYNLVQAYIIAHGYEDKITLLHNDISQGALFNHYQAVSRCRDHEIVINLDGDDWLPHNQVFAHINSVYADPEVWMTYGQYRNYPSGIIGQCKELPAGVIIKNVYREYDWVTSHLRTFYAKLFKKIRRADFIDDNPDDKIDNDQFFRSACDMAFMFPMLEMAGKHSRFIPDVLYEYNQKTTQNIFKTQLVLQLHNSYVIRARRKYAPIAQLFEQ